MTDAKLTWLPKKTFVLEFSLAWDKVKISYDKILADLVKNAKIEGFRPGKAPKDLVEKNLDKGRLYGEVINQLLPLSYAAAVSQHKLRPAVAPKITIIQAEENKPWQFKAESCELPEFKLGDYVKICRGALAKDKLWTPGKPEKDISANKDKEPDQNKKINLISKSLLEEIKIDLSDLLVETEQNRLLSRLLDQIQKLGLTIEQYASSNNKTVEALKEEYQKTAENTLKLELILQAIAEDKKYAATDKEIDEMINAAGDEKLKQQLNTPAERAYIASVLKKRQAIDFLLSL